MLDHHIRTRIWLADLSAINAEIDSKGLPAPLPRTKKRARVLKPLWQE